MFGYVRDPVGMALESNKFIPSSYLLDFS